MEKKYANKTILVSLAHPDDESFGMGGTLAYYSTLGASVHLICATNGDVGEVAEEYMVGFDTIAEVRRVELACASKHLGLADVIYLDYRDSGMKGTEDNNHPESLWAAPLDEVADKVLKAMRELKPDIVLTFDPAGGYLHPDHIKIHQATVRAYEMAEGEDFQPAALYYHIFPKKLLKIMVRGLRLFGKDATKFGRNKDIDLEELANIPYYPTHVKVKYDAEAAENKSMASSCHASQLDPGRSRPGLASLVFRMFRGGDQFMRAFPATLDSVQTDDLFDL